MKYIHFFTNFLNKNLFLKKKPNPNPKSNQSFISSSLFYSRYKRKLLVLTLEMSNVINILLLLGAALLLGFIGGKSTERLRSPQVVGFIVI
jgi:hypothetical protein